MSPANAQILIVEDDALVAMEMEARVSGYGYVVVGPASTIAIANRLLDQFRPDAALLDVNVCGERVTPIAARLRDMAIPYVLVTGYARLSFEEPELQVEKLSKPIAEAELARALRRLLNPTPAV